MPCAAESHQVYVVLDDLPLPGGPVLDVVLLGKLSHERHQLTVLVPRNRGEQMVLQLVLHATPNVPARTNATSMWPRVTQQARLRVSNADVKYSRDVGALTLLPAKDCDKSFLLHPSRMCSHTCQPLKKKRSRLGTQRKRPVGKEPTAGNGTTCAVLRHVQYD